MIKQKYTEEELKKINATRTILGTNPVFKRITPDKDYLIAERGSEK